MLKTAKQHGFPDDYTTYALVSGIFNAFFALGAFIGPTIGGIMDDYMGFEWAAFVVGMIELACFLLLLVYCIRNYKVEIKGETPLVEFLDSSADERKPLLTKNPTSEFF
ncbi:PREDICTED: MFS-type transporter SLC18B1-like [Priapulus caudatus]|uniref:MFS-type transporter SLC18B1-like n=1 Tax=Priapulus caudatus TaxID=37621 RepID=A0ABM1DPM8_PRICU|nr:PREDICTED: MFS-type transporter SLC18B1-like [Priapulus caudatus]